MRPRGEKRGTARQDPWIHNAAHALCLLCD